MSEFMIIGELYLVKEYCWFMFPTKELAGAAGGGVHTAASTHKYAKWFSERYNYNVSFFGPDTYVLLLEVDEDERFYKLLDSNGNVGWIYCWDFSRYFEFVKE